MRLAYIPELFSLGVGLIIPCDLANTVYPNHAVIGWLVGWLGGGIVVTITCTISVHYVHHYILLVIKEYNDVEYVH